MKLDLQSVEKVAFSTFAWALASKILEIGLPRLKISCNFLQDLSRAVSRFPKGPVSGNHCQYFFDPTGSNTNALNTFFRSDRGLYPWWSGKPLRKTIRHSEARIINFLRFRGKSSCERTERNIFNGLEIELHRNLPYVLGDVTIFLMYVVRISVSQSNAKA